jgi:tetratricopeptide (TPR) repeat protein
MSKYISPLLQFDGQRAQGTDKGGWLRDLALSYREAGDVFFARGRFAKASEKYQASLNLFKQLAANNPRNPSVQIDLAHVRARVADAHVVEARAQIARLSGSTKVGWLQRAIRILSSFRLASQ